MNDFLNQLGGTEQTMLASRRASQKGPLLPSASAVNLRGGHSGTERAGEGLLLRRDRALLELLYAAGLRVSALTGLNLAAIEQKERILRVRGKGNKERIVPYGTKAQEALEKYSPLRQQLLTKSSGVPGRHKA